MKVQENGGIYLSTLKRFRKPIASGCARDAYYSRKFNLVFKTHRSIGDTYQTERELNFFNKLPKKFLSIFPVVAFTTYNHHTWVVMRRVKIAASCKIHGNLRYELPWIEREMNERGHTIPNLELVQQFLARFRGLGDLHYKNWGFDENWNIQIVDWGL